MVGDEPDCGMAFEGLINVGDLDNDLVTLNDNGSHLSASCSLHGYPTGFGLGAFQPMRDCLIKCSNACQAHHEPDGRTGRARCAQTRQSGYIFEDLAALFRPV